MDCAEEAQARRCDAAEFRARRGQSFARTFPALSVHFDSRWWSEVKRFGAALLWIALALAGAAGLGAIALFRGEGLSATWFVIAAGCTYLVAYRFYSAFIAVQATGPARPSCCHGRSFTWSSSNGATRGQAGAVEWQDQCYMSSSSSSRGLRGVIFMPRRKPRARAPSRTARRVSGGSDSGA